MTDRTRGRGGGTDSTEGALMDKRSILTAQSRALLEDLNQIENILNSLQAADPSSGGPRARPDHFNLLARVRPRFDILVHKQRAALKTLERDIAQERAPSDCWAGLRAIRRECKQLFQECLALMEGVLVRRHGIDGGLCRLADVILEELSVKADIPWQRFTIWADSESFANLAEIIRVRFPSKSIWHLPVMAHEFGHFVSREWKAPGTFDNPFREVCQRYEASDASAFLPEHFADIFAAYSVGPAYACSALLLRFDHGAAEHSTRTHPSGAARAHVILRTLGKMDEGAQEWGPPQFESIRRKLTDVWQNSLADAFQNAKLEQSHRAALEKLADELYEVVASDLPPGLRYDGWLRAQRLSHVLRSPGRLGAGLNDEDTLLDVLNAAWLSRLRAGDDPDAAQEISRDALKLCEAVLKASEGSGRVRRG